MPTNSSSFAPAPPVDVDAEIARASPAGLAWYADGRNQTADPAHGWLPFPHLDLLSHKLMQVAAGQIRRLIVTEPPRHGKSVLISQAFPAWYLGTYPRRQVMLASNTAALAEGFSRKARDTLIEHGAHVFGVHVRTDSKAASRWQLAEGGIMVAAGIGGPLTGRGAHLLLLDDPIKNAEEAASDLIREKQWDWWLSTARTRLMRGGSVVLVLTRWHEDDLAGRMLTMARDEPRADQWEMLNLPALAEPDAGGPPDPIGRAAGEPLCPELMSVEELDTTRISIGSYYWQALYQQRPAPEEGGIFRTAWWRYYPREWQEAEVWGGPPFQRVWQSWDTALKDKTSNDFTVGQLWGQDLAQRFLLRQVCDRWPFHEALEQVVMMHAWASKRFPRHASHLVFVENAAMGPELIAAARRKIQGLVPVTADADKVSRAYAVTPQLEAGNVVVPGAPNQERTSFDAALTPGWVQDLITQCSAFPNAANDDQVDALTQGLDPRRLSGQQHRGRGQQETRMGGIRDKPL